MQHRTKPSWQLAAPDFKLLSRPPPFVHDPKLTLAQQQQQLLLPPSSGMMPGGGVLPPGIRMDLPHISAEGGGGSGGGGGVLSNVDSTRE